MKREFAFESPLLLKRRKSDGGCGLQLAKKESKRSCEAAPTRLRLIALSKRVYCTVPRLFIHKYEPVLSSVWTLRERRC